MSSLDVDEKPCIVIIDPVSGNLNEYERNLKPLGLRIVFAQSFPEATLAVGGSDVVAALLDITFFEPNSTGFAQALVIGGSATKIPVIVLTNHPLDGKEVEKCCLYGATDFMVRPFGNGVLSRKVELFIEQYRLRQEVKELHQRASLAAKEFIGYNEILEEQNEFYSLLLGAIPLGIQIIDMEGSVLYQNQKLRKYFNGEAIGKKCWELYDNNKSQCSDCPLLSGLNIGETATHKALGVISGRVYQVHHTGMLYRGNRAVLEVFQDITEPTFAHEALRVNDESLRNIIENLPLTLFIKEAKDLRYVQFNRAGEELLGCSKSDVIGRYDHEIFMKEEADIFVGNDRRAIRTGEMVDIAEESIRTKGNGVRVVHTRKIPVYNKNGEPEYILGLAEDITLQKQAEEELRTLFEMSADMVCIIDTERWIFKKVNPAFSKILGIPEQRFVGTNVMEYLHPDDRQRTIDSVQVNLQQGFLATDFENRYRCADGSYRWLKWIVQMVPEKGVIHAIAHDITLRKEKEDALRESEKMYRTLLNASPEGIIILDLKGRITEVSNIALEIFGVESKEEFIGEYFYHFIPGEESEKLKDVLKKTQTEGLVQNVEFILSKKRHSMFICEISTTLIQEADGKPKAYMAVIRDISQRKKIEQKLIRTERMVCLGEMASAMAHEINQPLLSISLGIENLFLKLRRLNAVEETYLKNKSEKIFEDILRIEHIIDHVRAFSRDHDDFIATSFNINDSIRNAVSMISEQYKKRSIRLIVKLDKGMQNIIGNTFKFEQVILNLLNNGKDALEDKSRVDKMDFEKIIEIKSFHDAGFNYVEVRDNGIGIRTEDIDRVMLPFYTTKEVGKGTGLGLSISFGIVKEHNGNIEVESEYMRGTLFRITLPY